MGATAGITSGIQTLGSFAGQQMAADALDSQRDFSSRLAALNARDAVALGETAAHRHRAATRQLIGSQRAALAANGVSLDTGSALDVQTDSARMGALDEATIRNNAAREAWGISAQSTMDRLASDNRAAALRYSSVDTLLTGSAKTYGLIRDWKTNRSPTGARKTGRQVAGDGGYDGTVG